MNETRDISTSIIKPVSNEKTALILRQIIQEKGNVLITGERSSGKTLLLSHLMTLLPEEDNVLMFDFYSEVKIPTRKGRTILVGYKENADIRGHFGKKELQEMVDKSLLLPFDRVVADELYGEETGFVFKSLYQGRSGYFVVPGDSAENALKFLFLQTIYPQNKRLQPEHIREIEKVFQYVITVNKEIIIEKMEFQEDTITFTKIN